MTSTPVVTVVIPTYRRAHLLPPLVEALAGQTLEPERFEVVVVDNASHDDTGEMVARLAQTVPFRLRCETILHNDGPARARNVGWRAGRADIVAFLDDDCTPDRSWLAAGVACFERSARLGVLQGRTDVPAGVSVHGLADWWLWRIIHEPSVGFEACNIFYRRVCLEATGGFDEALGWWGEDTAAGWAVVEAGWDRGFCNEARVVHPLEWRGWRWYVTNGLREANIMAVAALHPQFRQAAFWRPWAYRREDVAFLVALLGVLAARRAPWALAAALPYLWWRRPSIRRRSFFRLCVQVPIVDAARLVGQLRGALRYRVPAL